MTPDNKIDAEAFSKLGVSTVLDLALLTPHRFENNHITPIPENGLEAVVSIVCKDGVRRAKSFYVKAWCETWQTFINLLFFHPKPFHYVRFKSGECLSIKGKIQNYQGVWQFLQPKIIIKINTIIPQYKTPLRSAMVASLVERYLNLKDLEKEGIDLDDAATLLKLHLPTIEGINSHSPPFFEKEALPVLKYTEVLNHLKKLSEKKRFFAASAKINSKPEFFIKSLPFILTEDQQLAIEDIVNDLKKPTAAKRVIMGDVGCGKTVVMLAVMAMIRPHKAILMVPTTILAAQIYEEAKRLLPKDFNIALVAGNKRAKNLEKADAIIGTHALLYDTLPICDVVMVDEQHRFGTKQRDALHKMVSEGEEHPHFFQFTATPIPRTLSMMHATLVDYTFIKQTPFVRDISTKIITKSDFSYLLNHIKNEIKQKHQVAIIYPLTEQSDHYEYQSLEEARGFWEKRFEKVYVTHGKDREKETILEDFAKNGNILLATTVVEVGISLPKLSTIVIVGAERMGLASLHQLRGRVSRTGLKGFCFLFTYKLNIERLEAFTKTTSGFEIAELDLKYRQSGSVLDGIIQHGETFKWFNMQDREILEKAKKRLGTLVPKS